MGGVLIKGRVAQQGTEADNEFQETGEECTPVLRSRHWRRNEETRRMRKPVDERMVLFRETD